MASCKSRRSSGSGSMTAEYTQVRSLQGGVSALLLLPTGTESAQRLLPDSWDVDNGE